MIEKEVVVTAKALQGLVDDLGTIPCARCSRLISIKAGEEPMCFPCQYGLIDANGNLTKDVIDAISTARKKAMASGTLPLEE